MAKKIDIKTELSTDETINNEALARRYGTPALKSARGPRKKKFIVTMPESLHYEIMAIAKVRDLSVNNLINEYLEEYVKEHAEDVQRYRDFKGERVHNDKPTPSGGYNDNSIRG